MIYYAPTPKASWNCLRITGTVLTFIYYLGLLFPLSFCEIYLMKIFFTSNGTIIEIMIAFMCLISKYSAGIISLYVCFSLESKHFQLMGIFLNLGIIINFIPIVYIFMWLVIADAQFIQYIGNILLLDCLLFFPSNVTTLTYINKTINTLGYAYGRLSPYSYAYPYPNTSTYEYAPIYKPQVVNGTIMHNLTELSNT